MIDLDELAAVVAAMSSRPWRQGEHLGQPIDTIVDDADQLVMYAGGADGDEQIVMSIHDRAGMLAVVNAAPELLAEVERLRSEVAAIHARARDVCSFCLSTGGKRLIVGPAGNICDGCVTRAARVLTETVQ